MLAVGVLSAAVVADGEAGGSYSWRSWASVEAQPAESPAAGRRSRRSVPTFWAESTDGTSRAPAFGAYIRALPPAVVAAPCETCSPELHSLLTRLPLAKGPSEIRTNEQDFWNTLPARALDFKSTVKQGDLVDLYRAYARQWPHHKVRCMDDTLGCRTNQTRDASFDISSGYLYDRAAWWAMAAGLPHAAKLTVVVVVRDPVARVLAALSKARVDYTSQATVGVFQDARRILHSCYPRMAHEPGTKLDCKAVGTGKKQQERVAQCVSGTGLVPSQREFRFATPVCGAVPGEPKLSGGICTSLALNMLWKGLYADQLRNMVCAGFAPARVLVATPADVRHKPRQLLKQLVQMLPHPPAPPRVQGALAQVQGEPVPEPASRKPTQPARPSRIFEQVLASQRGLERVLRRVYDPFTSDLLDYVPRAGFKVVSRSSLSEEFLGGKTVSG